MRPMIEWGRAAGFALLVALAFGSAPQQADAAPPQMPGVQMVQAWPGMKFDRPICVTNNGSANFICQQTGKILRADKYRGSGPVPQPTVYLDLTAKVDSSGQGGVLSLVFHPTDRSRFFVSYLARGSTSKFEFRVSEFQGTAMAGNPASEYAFVRVPMKRNSHQAGGLAFGPDGMLYVAIGDDGEMTPATQMIVQSEKSKLGKILRIDVSAARAPKVPADNPWATLGGEFPLIFAYGYRNPWRIAFDSAGRLWTLNPGTKGPTSQEWISIVPRGGNGRWPYYEGTMKRPNCPGEPRAPAPAPAFAYNGIQTGGDNAGVAGLFYRGKRLPALVGKYIFADYMQKGVYALDLSTGTGTGWVTLGTCKGPADIGEDADGELYVCAIDSGVVYTLIAKR